MKKTLLTALLLLGFITVQAQDFFLPVSTESVEAKEAYQKAFLSLQHADVSRVDPLLNQALEHDPEFFMVYAHRALYNVGFSTNLVRENINKALLIPEEGLTQGELILRKALLALYEDENADIYGYMEELTEVYPTVPQAYDFAMKIAYFINDDGPRAVENGKMLVKLSPDYSGGYNMLGYAYMKAGEMKPAKEAFQTYIKMAKDEANPYDSMGEYYMTVRDYKKSAKYYQKASDMGMKSSAELAEKARSLQQEKVARK